MRKILISVSRLTKLKKTAKVLVVALSLLIGLKAEAISGLQKVTCMSSDLQTPVWVREYFVDFQDHYQNLLVARELQRENSCSLGLKNTIYLSECHTVQYKPISCQ